jgi:hypothetical protein
MRGQDALDNLYRLAGFVALGNGHFVHARWIHPPAVSPGGHNRRYQALPGSEDLLLIVERTI